MMPREFPQRPPPRPPEPERKADSSGFPPPPPQQKYFPDMDYVLKHIADNMPIADSEHVYLWELEGQRKVYIALMCLAVVMTIFSFLLRLAART